jgi:uncharacterized membrane protein YgcG
LSVRDGEALSTTAELLIYLGVIAAARILYVVRQVRRERRRQAGRPGPADAYEGNLVVPAVTGHRGRGHGHGVVHGGHGGGFGGHGGDFGGHPGHGGGHDAGGVHH